MAILHAFGAPTATIQDLQGICSTMDTSLSVPRGALGAGATSVVLAATFTAEPLLAPLGHFLREVGLPLGTAVAPYGQIFQQLLDPTSQFLRNRGGVNVVLLRFEDWLRDEGGRLTWSAGQAQHARTQRRRLGGGASRSESGEQRSHRRGDLPAVRGGGRLRRADSAWRALSRRTPCRQQACVFCPCSGARHGRQRSFTTPRATGSATYRTRGDSSWRSVARSPASCMRSRIRPPRSSFSTATTRYGTAWSAKMAPRESS
jgi:hypothetical protein